MEAKPKNLLRDLPDDILDQIFSLLQVKDMLRLRISSKSFHEALCITAIPSFCFSDHPPHDSDPDNCSCTHVFDFMMNTVPQNRPHDLTINRISFSSFCHNHKHRKLHKQWIIQLFRAFLVEELFLDYHLPSIFRSLPKFQSLKVLKLNMKQVNSVKLPKMKLASLETLYIKSIDATDYSLSDWISQSFPSLKHLFLQNITDWTETQDFAIRSSSLEALAIHDLCCYKPVRIITENLRTFHCYFGGNVSEYYKTNFILETSAPNLQSLSWVGRFDTTRLYHDDEDQTFQNLQVRSICRSLIVGESNRNALIQLFKAIRSARELHIDTQVLEHWVRTLRRRKGMLEVLHGETLMSLRNLRHLEIHVRFYVKGEDYVTFLERLPNLETLTLQDYLELIYVLDFNSYLKERHVRDKFKEALRNCRNHELRRTKGLKKVKLIIRQFCNYNMVVAIGWLIKSCRDLEEITLYYPSCFHKFMMHEGFFYLQRFERASPTPPSFHFFPQQNLIP